MISILREGVFHQIHQTRNRVEKATRILREVGYSVRSRDFKCRETKEDDDRSVFENERVNQ